MTYQSELASNKYAKIAIATALKRRLPAERMRALAWSLLAFEEERAAQGKPTADDHLRQQAAKLSSDG